MYNSSSRKSNLCYGGRGMRVLLVIHGYPRRYNAGSEIYTQTLAHALADSGCEVSIFSREEDPFLPDYQLRTGKDSMREDIPVYLVNHARSNSRFQNDEIDAVFRTVVDTVKPDIVHYGHLNHLSMGLPKVSHSQGIPTVFTLHDFWMMCPRGQFLQWGLTANPPWALCDGQEDEKCATQCFNRYVEGLDVDNEIKYWGGWVNKRMRASREACDAIDLFLAPSRKLIDRHVTEFGLSPNKVKYLDYGFDLERLQNRNRKNGEPFVFGFIGRHHPSKGIHDLIDAFCNLEGDSLLRIWGRPEGQLTSSLKRRVEKYPGFSDRIEWFPEYKNEEIVSNVFNLCDCIVVPSIWDENSPLVIHESQQCSIPVITANHGGMGEYVVDGVNGLTFEHRNGESLRKTMQHALDNPNSLMTLGLRGYLYSDSGGVLSKEAHAATVINHYQTLIDTRKEVEV
jgi:glycosyltransferase involved in cell wall biosynthesis